MVCIQCGQNAKVKHEQLPESILTCGYIFTALTQFVCEKSDFDSLCSGRTQKRATTLAICHLHLRLDFLLIWLDRTPMSVSEGGKRFVAPILEQTFCKNVRPFQ